MKCLYLLRHAKSCWEESALDDFHRPLNKRGRRAAALMAGYFARRGLRPDVVLCSAAERTRQTLDALKRVLNGVPVSLEEGLYVASMSALLERLRRLDGATQAVLLIGHNPGIEQLALRLAGIAADRKGLERMREKYPTAALAELSASIDRWDELQAGCCRLEGFTRPADLKA
ncbi:MAG: histidine phosphatase family protein [Rhodospirillales bacterium]|nr:histidine phosphatase family protein [Rhodospirillales bacterium]